MEKQQIPEKMIFDFETAYPPILNQRTLERELERRKIHLQTTLLAVAALFMELSLILAGILLRTEFPVFTAVCFGYVICSSAGGGILAVVFHIKKEEIIWQE